MSQPPAPAPRPPPNDAEDRWKYVVASIFALGLAVCVGVLQALVQ